MSDHKISVEVQIADRRYPLRVAPNEEKFLRQAESELRDKLAFWQNQIAAREHQDYLALALLTTIVEDIKARKDRETKLTFFRTKVNSMNKHIEALSINMDTQTDHTEE
jgi:cell division protein ZapA